MYKNWRKQLPIEGEQAFHKTLCNGKICYSQNGAERVAKGYKVSRVTKKKSRAYLCPYCFFYHLTTHNRK